MTEKRFTYIKNSSISQYQSIPIQEIGKGKPFHCQGLVDELNKLWNENEQLKDALNQRTDQCDKYYKENKQLRQELKIYRKVASCSNCEYQNYDWFGDGDEFEVCERGNNEQQIEYHICEEWSEL